MLGFGVAEEVGPLSAVILFPLGEQFAAIAVAHLRNKAIGGPFDGAIAKRIHRDADRHLGERVALLGARQNRRLVAEPVHIAEEHEHEQASGAQSNSEMGARKAHQEKFGGWGTRGQGYFRYFRNWWSGWVVPTDPCPTRC